MSNWTPSTDDLRLLRQVAGEAIGCNWRFVMVDFGCRINVDDATRCSVNILLVSDDPDWEDSDLQATVDATSEPVPLLDGAAVIDGYIRPVSTAVADRYFHGDDLLGNMTLHIAHGRLSKITDDRDVTVLWSRPCDTTL